MKSKLFIVAYKGLHLDPDYLSKLCFPYSITLTNMFPPRWDHTSTPLNMLFTKND